MENKIGLQPVSRPKEQVPLFCDWLEKPFVPRLYRQTILVVSLAQLETLWKKNFGRKKQEEYFDKSFWKILGKNQQKVKLCSTG